MKIAIVGPSHPYKGGIVQHTTELAHRLTTLGHKTELIAWQSQFPSHLYPGSLLPADQPEMPPFPATHRKLSWHTPLSWWRTGRYLRSFDLVIFVWWVPTFQAPIYKIILHTIKAVPTAVICHNVLPHEAKPGDRPLARSFFSKVDHIIVHTEEQASVARSLTNKLVSITALPPLLPGWSTVVTQHSPAVRRHLLFFGIVRDYKGLDVLLTALAKVPDVALTVAGEFWGGTTEYDALVRKLDIGDRVTIRAGYIASQAIPALFQEADALVLPYRSATGTTNVRLGFAYKVPVIVSDIPALAEQVSNGNDGLVFANGDADSLAAAIRELYKPETFKRLHGSLPDVAVDSVWQQYIDVLLHIPAGPEA